MKTLKKVIFAAILVILIMCAASCKQASGTTTPVISEQLQNSVPFKIIIPLYLPDDLKTRTPMIMPGYDDPDGATTLRIIYSFRTKMIIIDEQNMGPVNYDGQGKGAYIEINDTQIYEGPSESIELGNGFIYSWNISDINFNVLVFGYDQSNARKVIKSMIN
jgi:hypothetical protein